METKNVELSSSAIEDFMGMMSQIGLKLAREQFLPQVQEFSKLKGPNGEFMRNLYLVAFIGTNARPVPFETFEEVWGKTEEELKQVLHGIVDTTSLVGPEIEFMHRLIDLDASSVAEYSALFDEVEGLSRCQNAAMMKECLRLTADLVLMDHKTLREKK